LDLKDTDQSTGTDEKCGEIHSSFKIMDSKRYLNEFDKGSAVVTCTTKERRVSSRSRRRCKLFASRKVEETREVEGGIVDVKQAKRQQNMFSVGRNERRMYWYRTVGYIRLGF
jgi:hypothetical protein